MAANKKVSESLCQFASTFYDKILTTQGANLKNVFVSPLSLYEALAMTMAGADGQTKKELLSALFVSSAIGVGQDPHQRIGEAIHKLMGSTADVEVAMGNRLFVLQQATILKNYDDIIKKAYQADVTKLDSLPDNEAKRNYMNKWVSGVTREKIKELIPQGVISSDTILTLLNALYFKGAWGVQFDKQATSKAEFNTFDGKPSNVMMMRQKAHYPYAELDDLPAQAIRLPFKGSRWEMLIVLPFDQRGLPEILEHLRKPGQLSNLLEQPFAETEVTVFLPKFKLDEAPPVDAKELLKMCGVTDLFDPSKADLSQLCTSEKLFVSQVLHKAVLEVDEEGATAAAATAVMMNRRCAMMPPTFRVDRPFFVALVCDSTVPVFLGHVMELPNAA